MKLLFITLLSVFLLGCESNPGKTMQGKPVRLKADAYAEMCIREPDSVLCPHDEFFVTNSKSLNQQWCDICAKDSSYSWCIYFPECVTEQKPARTTNTMQSVEPQAPQGETMQGKAIRLRAQAYEDLCARTPESVLCN